MTVRAGSARPFALGLVVLGLAAVAAWAPVQAQPPAGRVVRLGYLHIGLITPEPSPERQALLEGLRALGYEVGRNLSIEYRGAAMRPELLPDMVEELVNARVEIIVAVGSEAATVAKKTAPAVPVVAPAMPDPLSAGLVASLARPGGNLTGLTVMSPELAGKRLQLLKEAFPRATRVAVLWNPGTPGAAQEWQQAQAPARVLGLALQSFELSSVQQLPAVLAALGRERPQALYVISDPVTSVVRHLIAEAAAKQRLPSMHGWREFVEAGGLMGYGASMPDLFRRSALYVDRILKGAKPSELPVEQPTKFDFVVNLKTAQALGVTMPPAVLVRADDVIR